jgi:hypothetical protein
MNYKTQYFLFLLLFFSFTPYVFAQNKIIKGKITNSQNGEAVAFAKVQLIFGDGTKQSIDTDFDGIFQFQNSAEPDSIVVENDGFARRSLPYKNQSEFLLTLFPLVKKEAKKDRIKNIEGVVIQKKKKKYSNPAYEILEKFVARKPLNNPDKYNSYHYENYSRMEISMSDFGEKVKKRKVYKDIKNLLEKDIDTADKEVRNFAIPVFVSENLSDIYFTKNPERKSEIIKKTKTDGIGIDDGTMFSQLMTSTFIKYNFYNNYIRILGKDFISPVNDNFKIQYDYELINKNFEVDGEHYYVLNFKPTREADLAFVGTVLIAHGSYALFRMDATVTPNANLNFIHSLRIQQEMTRLSTTENDLWFPGKTRVFLETAKPGKESLAVYLKYYASTKNIATEINIDPQLLEKKIVLLDNAEEEDVAFWNKNRHDSLGIAERKMLGNISQIKKLPSVKTYIDVIDLLLNGYYKVGKVGFGPFPYLLGYNDYEGFRMRLGFQTNRYFSKKWTLGGYASYGFRDQAMKYGAKVDYIFSREPWIQGGVSYSHDLGQVAFQYEDFSMRRNNLFDAFGKNGKILLRKPFWQDSYQAYLQADVSNSINEKIILKHDSFDPIFPFSYQESIGGTVYDKFKTTEIIAETSWKPGRVMLESSNNKQMSLKDNVYQPTITFRYTKGLKGMLGGDFNYNKLHLNIQQIIPMGLLGRGEYSLTGGWILDKVPYPLLENHLGNQFGFYNKYAFNMMRFFEFTSNKYASIQYTQHLEGLIANSLPLIKKWNWRNHVTFNYLVGSLDPSFVQNSYIHGEDFQSLNNKPYFEFGYGISNIFRFLRIDFIHRMSHMESVVDGKLPPKFMVKFSAQIRL